MRILKLMADYQCFPLWELTPGVVGPVDPRDLPISHALCVDLMNWAADYDATLNLSDPTSSGFLSPVEEENFKKAGELLGARLKAELGDRYQIHMKI